MKITIVNYEKKEKRYTRVELDELVTQLADGTFLHQSAHDFSKEVCFAAELVKQNGEVKAKILNGLVLLSIENLRDLPTVREYKEQAARQLYTLLCFIGHDGHSLRIVCRYDVTNGEPSETTQLNAFRKLHYIYSSQLGTQVANREPSLSVSCKAGYDPQPYYNPEALAIAVSPEPEDTPEYRSVQEDISDYNFPEEIPGMSVRDSRMRRFHDCLDAAIEAHLDEEDEHFFAIAVLEHLADGCRQMGLPQAWCARVTSFYPRISKYVSRDTIDSVFKSAYLKETLKTIPLKFTRPSALLAYKTEAYMKEHYTLRLNVMTGVPEYRMNALGYGFQPLDQAARNTMAIKALKAGVDSWDKDLSRYIDSNLIPRYEPMADYMEHLPKWNGKHDYVGELARRVKTQNPYWEEDFHKWMLSMVAQWLGKDRQHGNAIVPLLISAQGMHKSAFCRSLLPPELRSWGYTDNLSLGEERPVHLGMAQMLLINLDEFNRISPQKQQGFLKNIVQLPSVKVKRPYASHTEEVPRLASFIATTNMPDVLYDPTGSRRFLGIEVTGNIDVSQTPNYAQLFAQAQAELQAGARYWFDDKETAVIMEHNRLFQQQSTAEQFFYEFFEIVEPTATDAQWMSSPALLMAIKQHAGAAFKAPTPQMFGRILCNIKGLRCKRLNTGRVFCVRPRF